MPACSAHRRALANLAQALAVIGAAGCVFWCYRRPMVDDLRLAVLLAATILAAPHVIDYDTLLLGIAATLFFVRGYADDFRFGEITVAVLVWASPLINPPTVFRLGFVTPLLVVLFIFCVIARGRRDAVQAAPGGILTLA